jgi:large subunit ribosomal protein L4
MAEAPRLGGGTGTVALDPEVWEARWNEGLVHECVRADLAARRRGTAATRTRGEVRGGGAKPWRQKGTGRARAGSIRSPIWTGGGTTFGPSPRSFTIKVNRKARRAALRSALSLHAGRGSLAVLEADAFDAPQTKRAAELLGGWDGARPTLVALGPEETTVEQSFRNIARVSVLPAESVGIADLIGAASLVVSEAALEALTARGKGEGAARAASAEADPSAEEAA